MRPILHVCVTCRAGRELEAGEDAPGLLFHDEVVALAGEDAEVRAVKCLCACGRGCAAAIASPGKWTTILGGLSAGLAGDLLAYARAYAASETGTVLPSRRAESLRSAVIGRVPG